MIGGMEMKNGTHGHGSIEIEEISANRILKELYEHRKENEDGKDYEITYVNGEVTVKPKEITGVEWSNLEFVYNGETHNPTASVNGLINEVVYYKKNIKW